MLVLSLNCGSSSIKSALIDTRRAARLAEMRVEEVGKSSCRLTTPSGSRSLEGQPGFDEASGLLLDEMLAAARDHGPVEAVAHRIVHGGERFMQPARLNRESLRELDAVSQLAPLHNLPALESVRAAMRKLDAVPHVGVFDTAFHATLPRRARQYALPVELCEKLGIRRFGFHGTSHAHVREAVSRRLKSAPQALRIISCHLGNGASVAAIEYGRSVETSMGMTPLEGLVMGTRSGDLDPGAVLELMRSGHLSVDEVDELLNKRSGLKGLAGTNDMREIEERAGQGDDACRLAITLYAHRVRKYIGAYAAVMGGVDAIAFTGGVGENSPLIRHRCLQRLDFLGALLDETRNREAALEGEGIAEISDAAARTRLFVVKADEEMAIALETAGLLGAEAPGNEATRIPVAVSARHAHLSRATLERLFGSGYQLRPRAPLSQPGQYAAEETVALIGPRGRLEQVRLLGPPRGEDQVEISRSDEFALGVDAPVRLSGDIANTPGITLEGPRGRVTIPCGLIAARRHIHMNPDEARRLGLRDHDVVEVRVDSEGRDLVFGDVTVRVSPDFRLELHLDTDEANAAGLHCREEGVEVVCEVVKGRLRKSR